LPHLPSRCGTYRFTVFARGSDTEVVDSGTGKFTGHRINA